MDLLKRGVLFFWAAWFSIVAVTNILDALRSLGALPASLVFVSGNWAWINHVMDPLGVSRRLQAFLFLAAIGWEVLAAGLYWRALHRYGGRSLGEEPETLWACTVALALWGAFQVLDEVFLAYQTEDVHRSIFVSQIATILMLQLLPATPSMARAGGDPPRRPSPGHE